MSNVGDKESAVAKVYAAAMLEAAESVGQVDLLASELRSLADAVEADPDFQLYLDSPVVGLEARKLTIEKLFRGKYCDDLVDSLQVLNRNNRLGILRDIATAIHALREQSLGRVELDVRTAVPLTDGMRTKLREKIGGATGKQVDLLERIDASLIGGIVLQLGDRKFDGSIRRKLDVLTGALLERSSSELYTGKKYAVGSA